MCKEQEMWQIETHTHMHACAHTHTHTYSDPFRFCNFRDTPQRYHFKPWKIQVDWILSEDLNFFPQSHWLFLYILRLFHCPTSFTTFIVGWLVSWLVGWCFEPHSQPDSLSLYKYTRSCLLHYSMDSIRVTQAFSGSLLCWCQYNGWTVDVGLIVEGLSDSCLVHLVSQSSLIVLQNTIVCFGCLCVCVCLCEIWTVPFYKVCTTFPSAYFLSAGLCECTPMVRPN